MFPVFNLFIWEFLPCFELSVDICFSQLLALCQVDYISGVGGDRNNFSIVRKRLMILSWEFNCTGKSLWFTLF